MGIEPTQSAWKAEILPLNYTRSFKSDFDIIAGRNRFVNTFLEKKLFFFEKFYFPMKIKAIVYNGKDFWVSNQLLCFYSVLFRFIHATSLLFAQFSIATDGAPAGAPSIDYCEFSSATDSPKEIHRISVGKGI